MVITRTYIPVKHNIDTANILCFSTYAEKMMQYYIRPFIQYLKYLFLLCWFVSVTHYSKYWYQIKTKCTVSDTGLILCKNVLHTYIFTARHQLYILHKPSTIVISYDYIVYSVLMSGNKVYNIVSNLYKLFT